MNTLIENIRVIPDFSKVQILQLIGNPDILVLTTGKMGGDTREIYYFDGTETGEKSEKLPMLWIRIGSRFLTAD